MMAKRRTEITIETHRVTAIHARQGAARAWCEACGANVQMVTPEAAAVLARIRPRAIYRRVEAGEVHFVETAGGWLLVCLNSIGELTARGVK
jgi:hypothetical protein